jgi:hypothetical protein
LQVERPEALQEVLPQKQLADHVTDILHRIEQELDDADAKIGESMHMLDLDNDGLVRGAAKGLPMRFKPAAPPRDCTDDSV